jgi:hypothetical protein
LVKIPNPGIGTRDRPCRVGAARIVRKDHHMLGKLAGAIIGEKMAGRNRGLRGALMGAGVAAVARRGLGPLALALGAGWAAKKMWDKRQERRSPSYPSDAAPS